MAIEFFAHFTAWAQSQGAITSVGLVGSHARDAARPDSDIDLIVLTTDPETLIQDHTWCRQFGIVESIGVEDYGAIISVRVHYTDGLEVEYGIGRPSWAAVPLDAGTRGVISDGLRILWDPQLLLQHAQAAL